MKHLTMDLSEKNKEILKKFNKKFSKRLLFYSRSIGPGFLNKIKRLIIAPELLIPYLFLKLKKIFIKKQSQIVKIKLFWCKSIKTDNPMPSWYFYPIFTETNLVRFFIKNLNHNDIFYDIGANYGFYTYLALELCKEVHSFEPIDYVAESIKLNCQKEITEKRLFINEVALSNKNGESEFYLYENHIGSSSMVVNGDSNDKKIIKVQTIILDDYLKNHKPPTVIKMDVEGSEKLVIEGGINFFKNNSPIISMEVWSKNGNGEISMQAVNLLRNLGYQSFYIDFDGNLHKIDGYLSEFVVKSKKGLDNFIF
jgi:FkbM family methyltransferase